MLILSFCSSSHFQLLFLSHHNHLIFLAMQKLVVELEVCDERTKQKAMKTVSGLSGIQLIQMEQKNKKLTVIGDIDPVQIVRKLRKHCQSTIVSVAPVPEAKKEEPQAKKDQLVELLNAHPAYNPTPRTITHFSEEDPNSCVIC